MSAAASEAATTASTATNTPTGAISASAAFGRVATMRNATARARFQAPTSWATCPVAMSSCPVSAPDQASNACRNATTTSAALAPANSRRRTRRARRQRVQHRRREVRDGRRRRQSDQPGDPGGGPNHSRQSEQPLRCPLRASSARRHAAPRRARPRELRDTGHNPRTVQSVRRGEQFPWTFAVPTEITLAALAARDGDQAAAAPLVRATQADVWRLCAHLGDQGETQDLAQETYLRAFRSLPASRAAPRARPGCSRSPAGSAPTPSGPAAGGAGRTPTADVPVTARGRRRPRRGGRAATCGGPR